MMIDLGDGWHARCADLELELDVLRARETTRRADLGAAHAEIRALRQAVLDERAAVHRRLIDAFRTEGVHAELVSRIMLRLVAIPVTEVAGWVPAQRTSVDVRELA